MLSLLQLAALIFYSSSASGSGSGVLDDTFDFDQTLKDLIRCCGKKSIKGHELGVMFQGLCVQFAAFQGEKKCVSIAEALSCHALIGAWDKPKPQLLGQARLEHHYWCCRILCYGARARPHINFSWAPYSNLQNGWQYQTQEKT
ncbi:uncharacterized protein EDB91DRAFT_1077778 [Suillus paluster]|uniref:uncharacterized protein n=1 Tax=Suillus paluster TaxID=48578 RepID=UPI001B867CF6|nr:uncharacterized protein EDB91DRAFT_1077778 [Suillus paluster]KAG1752350.1 hypothetical protein EDB91DRAFT_1077778 [Suillus paluster]